MVKFPAIFMLHSLSLRVFDVMFLERVLICILFRLVRRFLFRLCKVPLIFFAESCVGCRVKINSAQRRVKVGYFAVQLSSAFGSGLLLRVVEPLLILCPVGFRSTVLFWPPSWMPIS